MEAKLRNSKGLITVLLFWLLYSFAGAQSFDITALKLAEEGFSNVRSARENDKYRVYTIENDRFKLPVEGFRHARQLIEFSSLNDSIPVKLIGTYFGVPQITMTYDPKSQSWKTTSRLDKSWDLVRKTKKLNSSFGNINLVLYPQVSLKNLIINQVYQSLWQLSPALEISLWQGAKFSYQLKLPLVNDGYGAYEDLIHPGMITFSQRFRDPWHLNITGKLTLGTFSNSRQGAVVEMMYRFPNERFTIDTQFGFVGLYYYNGFHFKYGTDYRFKWNVAANYYWKDLATQFTARVQRFLVGDLGVKCEAIRHFRHSSVGFYAEKGFEKYHKLNVGFRFQIALPPYQMKRSGRIPKISTSAQMGMAYNSNNEQIFYKEFKTESSDNIMEANYFNPLFLQDMLKK